MRSAVLVFLALLSLAPVLKTLTEATSSDSIWALAFFLFFLHTLLADYTAPRPYESRERYMIIRQIFVAYTHYLAVSRRCSL